MMVYILCVDGSSGVEELQSVRERATAMQSERETPNGHRGGCRLVFISDQNSVDRNQLDYHCHC